MPEREPLFTDRPKPIFVHYRGKLLTGQYRADRGTVTVTSQTGRSKVAPAWPSTVEAVARVLLMELEQEQLRDGVARP